jgi:hypothetical protein
MDHSAGGHSREEDVGRPTIRMLARFAKGGVPHGAHAKVPVSMMPRIAVHIARGLLAGKARPSPFFDAAGQPRATPTLMDKQERETLRARVLRDAGLSV